MEFTVHLPLPSCSVPLDSFRAILIYRRLAFPPLLYYIGAGAIQRGKPPSSRVPYGGAALLMLDLQAYGPVPGLVGLAGISCCSFSAAVRRILCLPVTSHLP